ncbi:alpha/beta fold hydrolase [Pelagimonas varians]|uniref:Haloacetate dehalogenase H-1 n=1 Tax=Pelagimonas varians TaxID=696760 RepID=A0A238KIY5_9RHOB|nr:alpha/beta hydrolase [Pelagimonas varians]PYG32284.1 haloacetate dehalogenase [Pelagimonas varians]SMX42026.1 Haloacetate dehalogenase H-1 [Pelagimonas varians]|tara:strand:- start:10210 stop:11115 length:906 start_codon:yes stop_codon:yes gene_type:complete
MFEGFTEQVLPGDGTDIFVRSGGPENAEPLVLIHGYPQTSAMWHLVAPKLAETYRVICPDLRGYGRSGKPATDAEHAPYSKRAMANDIVAVMQSLGHDQFLVGAHDRGARVAHRLGMDHAGRVKGMVLLDIAPTREMYANTSHDFAKAYWHWYFLIQKHPLPETIIGENSDSFWKLKCFNQAGGDNVFSQAALAEYLSAFRDPAVIHASCEDYRAAATIDIRHDDADAGAKLTMPLLTLWAKQGVIGHCFDAAALWKSRAENLEFDEVDASHYMAEEIPDVIVARLLDFFDRSHTAQEAAL